MGHPYGWRHGRSIAAAPRKSNAMLPKSAVCLSKKKARRDALPDHFIVALMQECIKADMHNKGYVPPPDAAIDALLVLGLSDYLRDRDAVRAWVRDQVRHGWVSGSFCVDSIRVAHGPVRGVGGTFRRRDDHSHQAWVDRVRVIKAADAKLMTPPQLAQLLAAVTNITRKEERTELLQDVDSKVPSTGKQVVFRDLYHGTADDSRAAKAVYAGLESTGVLDRVHDIFQTHLKMRNVDPACYDFVKLQFWYVFAHVYTASQDNTPIEDGLASHVDDAVYGAAVWSLTGDNGQPGLWWKRSFRSEDYQIPVPMEAGDLALILRGTHHGVSRVPREKDRVTLSFHA